jgi:hypothetical protein
MLQNLDLHERGISAAVATLTATITALHKRHENAQTTVAAFLTSPNEKNAAAAVLAQQEADAASKLLAHFADADERTTTAARDSYVAAHVAEITAALTTAITEATKTRAAFRTKRGAELADIAQKLAVDETLTPDACYHLGLRQQTLEAELSNTELALREAQKAVDHLRASPDFGAYQNAKDHVRNVRFAT